MCSGSWNLVKQLALVQEREENMCIEVYCKRYLER